MSHPPAPPALLALLETLVRVPGLSGFEQAIGRVMAEHLTPYADAITIDPLGNVIARLGPEEASSRIAIVAHMDTVGFLVKTLDPAGFARVVPVGGVNARAMPATPVNLWPEPDGPPSKGTIAVRSQHLPQESPTLTPAEELIVQVAPDTIPCLSVTTPITFDAPVTSLDAHLLCAPYLDNRAGCAVLVDIARRLATSPSSRHTVYLVGSVQEETTCAGAMHALARLRPQAAIFVDGTVSYDLPATRHLGTVHLGGGPVLTAFLYTSGLNGWHAHPTLRTLLAQLARERDIPCQQDAVRGLMSDARVAGWLGIPSAIVGLPLRGKHGPQETLHLDDLRHSSDLLAAFLAHPLPDLTWS